MRQMTLGRQDAFSAITHNGKDAKKHHVPSHYQLTSFLMFSLRHLLSPLPFFSFVSFFIG